MWRALVCFWNGFIRLDTLKHLLILKENFPLQLLCSVDPRLLRLTPNDDIIYKTFREEFPNMDVKILNEDEMKSPEGKQVSLLIYFMMTFGLHLS